ncbi:MAG: metal-dependent hydrolase [Helicobacteraceae bacterium]|nr:metal-dependent hydrolase [Helicobacteraceae bacterium]
MIWRTHVVSSEAVALPLFYLATPTSEAFAQYLPIVAGAVAFGAILPDIDDPRSRVGRKLLPIAIVVSMLFRHRTATHSLVIWGALLFIALALWLFIPSIPTTALLIAIGVTGGSMLHILGDLMTTAPVRGALYPVSEKLFWILPRFMRFNVGSGLEQVYFLLFAIALGAFGMFALGDWIKAFDLSFGR